MIPQKKIEQACWEIEKMSFKGEKGKPFRDTGYDSEAVAAGYELAIEEVLQFLENEFIPGKPNPNRKVDFKWKTLISVFGKPVCEFKNFNQWVNHASLWLREYPGRDYVILCIDSEGYACRIGADFMNSDKKDRFPVRCYAITRSVYSKL
jgi:hypothetical protein